MPPRFIKQLIYGCLFLAIGAGIIYGLFNLFIRPAPTCFDNQKNGGETAVDCGGNCVSCVIKNLAPLQMASAKLLSLPGEKTSVLIEVRNLNANFGADRFDYTVTFFDASGATTTSVSHESFIYAGEIKNLGLAGLPLSSSKAATAKASITNVSWRSKEEFSKPILQAREMKAVLDVSKQSAIISGVVGNQNAYALSKVFLQVVISSPLGAPISFLETQFESFAPMEERSFEMTVPGVTLSALTPELVKVSVSGKR